MKISDAAFNLIVEQEVSSKSTFTKRYSHFSWPGGASGPTVAVGYDCGYVTKDEIRTDWVGILPETTIAQLQGACGKKGSAGQAFVASRKDFVTITWEQAEQEFRLREVPKWESRVSHALPNTDLLPSDSFGALVSLAYNRGTGGFSSGEPRFAEMRRIKELMALKQFNQIPAMIRSMKRLWNNGLVNRREQEALLFERGLAVMAGKPPQPVPTRTQIVIKKSTQAGGAAGAGAGGTVVAAAPQHAHWLAPLAIVVAIALAVCVTLYVTRHRLIPRDAPAGA